MTTAGVWRVHLTTKLVQPVDGVYCQHFVETCIATGICTGLGDLPGWRGEGVRVNPASSYVHYQTCYDGQCFGIKHSVTRVDSVEAG